MNSNFYRFKFFILIFVTAFLTYCTPTPPPKITLDQVTDSVGRSWRLMATADTLHRSIDSLWVQSPEPLTTSDLYLTSSDAQSENLWGAAEVINSEAPEYMIRTYLPVQGDWELTIQHEDNTPITFSFPVHWPSEYQTRVAHQGDWLAGVLQPMNHQYGIQEAEIALFKRQEQRFQPATIAKVGLQPWMFMGEGKGHGSQFNEDATPSQQLLPGHYQGQISYSMAGNWVLRLLIAPSDDIQPDTLRLDLTVTRDQKD
jgi:hypothetical protein